MRRRRTIALGLALLTLPGLFVLGGAELPFDPHDDIGPEEGVLATAYDDYIGHPITTNGVVVDANTNQVLLNPDGADLMVTVEIDRGHDITLQDGDHVSVSGTIAADRTTVVGPNDHLWVRAPWERTYMYAISFLAALLTALLIGNYWRFDRSKYHLIPRKEPIVPILENGDTDG